MVSFRVCGPLLGPNLLASAAVTEMEDVPPDALSAVDTVSREVAGAPPPSVTAEVLKAHVGAGVLVLLTVQARLTVPV